MATLDFSTGLRCRVCGKLYPKEPINFCTDDFGPLEVDYDYDAIARGTQPRQDRDAAAQHVALPRAAAARRRADRRPAGRRHAAGPGRPPGRRARRRATCGSRTTRSTSRRCRSRTASSSVALSKAREFGMHDGRLRLDRQPGQQRRRQRRRRRAGDATSSSRPTWSGPRSSAPASTARRSSASTAPTTR